MKKILLALLPLVFLCGCSKEDTLEGKTFAAFAYHANDKTIAGIQLDGYDAYYVFRFSTASTGERSTRKGSPQGGFIGEIQPCTYEYSYPNIKITYSNEYSGRQVTEEGKFIDRKTFRINDKEYILQ